MLSRFPYRVVVARWTNMKNAPSFLATIKVSGVEDLGISNKIADIISGYTISVRNFSYKMDEGMFEGVLNILVPNNDVLYGIIRKIRSIKGVMKASRQTSDVQ
jgi:GTP pyrophosphokinase